MVGAVTFLCTKKKSIILGNSLGNKYPNKVKVFNYNIYNKNIKNMMKVKKIVNKQISINKTFIDPYLLSKLKFKFRIDENKVIEYVKKNF